MVDIRPGRPTNEEDVMTVTAMPDTGHGSGWRHRVVAIGSGLGGLTATKALKHDLVSITDALVFLTRITAQATAHVNSRMSLWLQVIPTTAAVFTSVGVLITLYVAIIRKRKSVAAQCNSVVTASRGIRNKLGKAGADHAIHRIT
jgi:hypothetical protein